MIYLWKLFHSLEWVNCKQTVMVNLCLYRTIYILFNLIFNYTMRIVNYLKSLTLIAMVLTVATMTAANVDSRTAQAKAVAFMNNQPGTRFMASASNLKLSHAEKSKVATDRNDFYVFNYDNGGYVIVSGDDRAEEILGYGSGYFDMNNLPSNVAWWINHYKVQMEWLIANPKAQVETTTQLMSTMLTATTVPMLMTSTWDQEAPYYNQCPKYNGSYCMTGCVATAMAQVMYYWKYPAQLPALDAYTTAETPRFNVPALPGITLDWDNMLDDYSSVNYNTTQANAVAWLMRYCGQAVEMMYSPEGSGAYTEDECAAMIRFGYSSEATVKYRDDHNASDWNAMMQAELEAGRPILYGGNDYSAGGHAFVVDGYNASTSKYHVNFGWSGYDDNYYALDAFKGSGYTFKYYQDMIIGVYPEGSAIEKYAPVMAEATNVGTTSFKATWTDETPAENVTDYTLYVQSYDPNSETLLTETFAGVTVNNDGTSNISNSLDTYCDNAGWTGSYVYQGAGGTMKLGSSNYIGSLTTPGLDMSTSNGTITVKFNAKYYGSDASSVVVSCGNATQTVALSASATDYAVVLSGVNAAAGQKVTFACTTKKKRFYIDNIEIVTGNAGNMVKATETGDANSRVITGITGKNYTVTNLNEGGSYKFYVEANYTDGTKTQSNVETVTLEGSSQPVPEVIVDPETLTMTANVGETATATFSVLGADLTGNVTVTLNDANGVYTVNPTTISIADAQDGANVTVTYAPVAIGTHEATITVASEGTEAATVTLNGTASIQTVAPVMAAATNVGTTSFTATWTDETLAQNVRDYTLYVNKEGATGDLFFIETFAGVDVASDGTYDRGSSMDDYCDNAGWTGYAAYEAMTGGFKLGSGSKLGYITTPALDLTGSDGTITVEVNANSYGNDASSLVVSCGDVSQTIELAATAANYMVTLTGVTAAADQKVTLSCAAAGKRVYVHSVGIYYGAKASLKATETGDANSRVITGITDKTYTVTGLTAGETYRFYVVANYTDGTDATSNIEQVTLGEVIVPEMIVDPESLTMTANVGETETATFDLLAANLTGNVTITLNDENGVYSIDPDTVSIADAEGGAVITVTYAPTTTGEHTATVTLSSEGAEDVTVTLNGTAIMEAVAPVMLPADEQYVTTTSFRADWTDETPAGNVKDYTLYVNKKGEPAVPGELILNETFYSEDVPSTDSNTDIGAAGTLDENCDNDGWTGYGVYLAGNGGMKLGSGTKIGYLTTPALDLTNSGGIVTVKFNARSYGSDGSSVIVSCGEVADTIELSTEAADYTVVLNGVPAQADQNVTLSGIANKKRFYLYSVQVYSGEPTAKAISENGDENSRVITGITDKFYVIEGLTAGATYEYYVEANYIDGTKAASNIEAVTLLKNQDHGYEVGDVNHDKQVSITDVSALIDYLLDNTTPICVICADVNGDETVNISDVSALIDKLLESK